MSYNNIQRFSTINSPRSTLHSPKGMSLMEVLASMFVICIGLLGVLAVIPYGAYQTAKARNAENTSWLLANAEKDLQTMGLAQMHTWTIPHDTNVLQTTHSYDTNGTPISGGDYFLNHTTSTSSKYDCRTYLLVDPFNTGVTAMDLVGSLVPHVRVVGAGSGLARFNNLPLWLERLSGQDDLVYTTHSDKRTDFSGQNNKILSSGQYTWFFMFRPQVKSSVSLTDPVNWLSDSDVEQDADVDILGCYNRIPGEAKTVYARYVARDNPSDDYDPLFNGAAITFRSNSAEALDVSETKYIFISWPRFRGSNTLHHVEGCWCKIINATLITSDPSSVSITNNASTSYPTSYKRTIYVTGMPDFVAPYTSGVTSCPEGIPSAIDAGAGVNVISIRGLIIPGVMYHKRPENPITIK